MSTWKKERIVDLCEIHVDCVNRTAPVVTEPTPFKMIRTTNVKDGFIDVENVRYVCETTYKKWTRRLIPQKGDIILTREAPLGKVGMIRTNDKLFLGQRLYHFRPNPEKLNPHFLLYSLLADNLQGQIRGFGSGSTVEHMRLADVPELIIEVPCVETQKKIAGILSAYDDLIENNLRRIAILEEMAQSLYREWFVHFRFPGHESTPFIDSKLGKIPKDWEVKKLGDACHLTMGQSPKSEFYNDEGKGTPFHQGVTNFGDHLPADRLFCTVNNRLAEAGDILFSVRAPVGRINVADKRIVIGRGVSAIRDLSGHQDFLYFQLKQIFQEEDSMGNGAIFNAVTKSDMQGIDLLAPSGRLVEHFEEFASPTFQSIKNLTLRNRTLRQTRDLLLPKLLNHSGKAPPNKP